MEKTLHKLEYDKIIARLAGYCAFSCGRELAEALLPAASVLEAEERQRETSEGVEILRLYPTFSLGPVRNIREALHMVEIGGILDIAAIVEISDVCRAARQIRSFFSEAKGSFPILNQLARGLTVIKTIETAVEKAVGPDGAISDGASEKLYQIRRKTKITNERIRERLESLVKNPNTAKFLQEAIVTIRGGRYVVPVRQEYRAQVPGIVHDISASGASVFVEPMAVLELNNELQKLAREEEEEIAAILRALTMVIAGFLGELTANLARLAQMDLIFAKAKLSLAMEGVPPKMNETGTIRFRAARHPLIPAERVVPIDLLLDKNIRAMIITGPNTGGKTVTLKTIGLLTLMGLAGLHLPAESAEISIFDQVFADIGDEQSIEQSLSTFSSHMVNIVDILDRADFQSLVLLDELGAGTDPTEGAALAMAIISTLQKRGVKIVATTHYSELKGFAYNTPGCINASVEFDVVSLAPTYRLLMGVPGKSNAFEIARRLGLSERIIADAAELLTKEDAQVAELIANLEDLRSQVYQEREELEAQRQALADQEKDLAEERKKVEMRVAEEIRRANRKSQKILEETLEKSEKLFQEFKEKMNEEKAAERAYQESRRRLKSWQEQLEEQMPEKVYGGEAPRSLKVGQDVFIPKINQHGSVLALPDKNGEVAVQVGVLKMMLKLSDLRHSDGPPQTKEDFKRRSAHMQIEKASRVNPEIDIRGQEVAEAVNVLDKYIDDAFIAGLKQVRIIHGKGTGALRQGVTDYLKGHRLVRELRVGDYQEGGLGVTIAILNV